MKTTTRQRQQQQQQEQQQQQQQRQQLVAYTHFGSLLKKQNTKYRLGVITPSLYFTRYVPSMAKISRYLTAISDSTGPSFDYKQPLQQYRDISELYIALMR